MKPKIPASLSQMTAKSKAYRSKLAWWTLNTTAAAFIGFWLADASSCIEKAEEKVETASKNSGFSPYGEECLLLPPIVQATSNESELSIAEGDLAEAEEAINNCTVPCLFSKRCGKLHSDLKLSRANFSLLKGDCKGALKELESLRQEGELSQEALITWVWAKVEVDPQKASFQQAISSLSQNEGDDACIASTRGSLLGRLALADEEPNDNLLRLALREQDRAIILNPRSVLANYSRAITLIKLGRIAEAQGALDVAKDHLEGRQDPYLHHTQAMLYEIQGDTKKGLAELTAAVESGYPDPEFRIARGWALLRLGKYDDAERDFKRIGEVVVRSETSCHRTPPDDLSAEVAWGLAWVKYKREGVGAVDFHALESALARVTDPQLQKNMASDIAEFKKRRGQTSG